MPIKTTSRRETCARNATKLALARGFPISGPLSWPFWAVSQSPTPLRLHPSSDQGNMNVVIGRYVGDPGLDAIRHTKSAADCVAQMRKTQEWSLRRYEKLVKKLNRDVILLGFFYKEMSDLDENNFMFHALNFPQFVDQKFYDEIKTLFSHTVESREFAGERYVKPNQNRAYNVRYPTAKMHELCASEVSRWYRERATAAMT